MACLLREFSRRGLPPLTRRLSFLLHFPFNRKPIVPTAIYPLVHSVFRISFYEFTRFDRPPFCFSSTFQCFVKNKIGEQGESRDRDELKFFVFFFPPNFAFPTLFRWENASKRLHALPFTPNLQNFPIKINRCFIVLSTELYANAFLRPEIDLVSRSNDEKFLNTRSISLIVASTCIRVASIACEESGILHQIGE